MGKKMLLLTLEYVEKCRIPVGLYAYNFINYYQQYSSDGPHIKYASLC